MRLLNRVVLLFPPLPPLGKVDEEHNQARPKTWHEGRINSFEWCIRAMGSIIDDSSNRLGARVARLAARVQNILTRQPSFKSHALSKTSNGIKLMKISSFAMSSRSEVDQLARGLKARIGSLGSLT
jgi:hypothetical protein